MGLETAELNSNRITRLAREQKIPIQSNPIHSRRLCLTSLVRDLGAAAREGEGVP
jgi:hypothetical protein